MAASGMAKKPIFLLSETSEEEARRKVCSRYRRYVSFPFFVVSHAAMR
jgi:hypothetical protein